jgi:hypothetical protein
MRALALTLAATAAVSACGGSSSQPRTAPPVSASPVAAASPTPTGIDAPGPEGAAAFAKFFYAQVEQAFATNNPTLLEAISLPECESCQNLIKSVQAITKVGGRVDGYKITVTAAVAPASTGDATRVDVIRNSTTNTEYDAAGKVVSREPGRNGIEEQMNLRRVAGKWRVAKIIRIRVRG